MAKSRSSKKPIHHRVKKYELNHTERVLLAIIGVFGFILFWRGLNSVMDSIPLLNNEMFLVLMGLVLMYTAGLLIKFRK